MINPIINGFNFFLAIFNNLPYSVSAFIDLAFVLLIVVIIVHLFKGK